MQTSRRADLRSSGETRPARPEARTIAVSLVEVSESTLTQLKVSSTTEVNTSRRVGVSTSASVRMTAIIVAMSGSIMPTPFAMPATVTGPPSPEVISARAVFGTVSVVMMPRAQSSMVVSIVG